MDIYVIRSVSSLKPPAQSVIPDQAPPQSLKRPEVEGVKNLTPDAAPSPDSGRGQVLDIAA